MEGGGTCFTETAAEGGGTVGESRPLGGEGGGGGGAADNLGRGSPPPPLHAMNPGSVCLICASGICICAV
jgi:hypothetical protein